VRFGGGVVPVIGEMSLKKTLLGGKTRPLRKFEKWPSYRRQQALSRCDLSVKRSVRLTRSVLNAKIVSGETAAGEKMGWGGIGGRGGGGCWVGRYVLLGFFFHGNLPRFARIIQQRKMFG